jgi:hypothetical protein
MNNMKNYRQYLPYLLAIVSFIVLAYLFTPQVFSGKVVNQSDIASWRGMANEIIQYNEANPDKDPALWTNSMFSGMPATAISVQYNGDFTEYIYNLLFVGVRPPSYLIISMIGAFLMFLAFGVNIWLSFIGAIAVTFCAYNPQIIQVGHNSKMVAIAFMPWVLAAVAYAYRSKKPFWGALLFAFALSFQIKANHPQITYYLAIIVFGYALALFVKSIREHTFTRFLKISCYLLIAGALGIATNINHLWPTYEYSKYTMRGGSELSAGKSEDKSKGLDIAYATQWSYSPKELPNLMIPNYNGGSSVGKLSKDSETYKILKDAGYEGTDQIIKQMPLYWGPQPFTAGPMYMGAISIFLFVLGLILLKGFTKWWIAGVSLIAVLLSMGSHFMFFTELFFKYAPLYNKFRTVSMILVILQITIPLLAFITVDRVLAGEYEKQKVKRGILISLLITAGFSLLVALMPSIAGSFSSQSDSQLPEQLRLALINDRASLLKADAFRSFAFIILTAGALWLAIIKKLRIKYFYVFLALLVIVDLWSVDRRYLNDYHFVSKVDFTNQYAKRPVDEIILQDRDPNYRVLDLSVNTFNDSHVSYHHKTIGGYSPVKLQRYQDMIDYHIMPEMRRIWEDIKGSATIAEAQARLGDYKILNMLNTRYIIFNGSNPPLSNSKAMGNAWFVDSLVWAANADEEITLLDSVDLRHLAVVDERFRNALSGFISEISLESEDSLSSTIQLTLYSPNQLIYRCKTEKERIAVFSEIYYPAGWSAKIDGQPVEIIRVNYILRALRVPAGEHEIEFNYMPESIEKGATYSGIASGILIILLISGVLLEIKRVYIKKKK